MSSFIHPITPEAAIAVASNLREPDYREITEGHGRDPMVAIPECATNGETVYFTSPDDRIAGIAGVQPPDGRIWMLCTPVVDDFPMTFIRQSKKFIDSREDKLLWNVVDKRNTLHLKLLKFLGFKFLREFPFGPNNLPFIEFCYVPRRRCKGS